MVTQMTTADIKRSLREAAGGDWISKRRLKKWLQSGDAEVRKIVEGLSYRIQGQAELYFVPEVAERVKLQVVRGWS